MTAAHQGGDNSDKVVGLSVDIPKAFLIDMDRVGPAAKRLCALDTALPWDEKRGYVEDARDVVSPPVQVQAPSWSIAHPEVCTVAKSTPMENLANGLSSVRSCLRKETPPSVEKSSQFSMELSISTRRVHFSSELSTVVGIADANYDRRSIVVDLSKTPFALFHKDAVLMRKPRFTTVPTSCEGSSAERPPDDTVSSRVSRESDSYDTDASGATSDADSSSDEDEGPNSNTVGFYGVWKRVSSEGYEALLKFSGVPKRAAKIAVRKHPIHIIDHDGLYFRLIVKNGLSKVDNTFFIGDEPREDVVNGAVHEVTLRWGDLDGDGNCESLVLTSVCRSKGVEVIAIRTIEDGGDRLVLTQIMRRPAEKLEIMAKHIFHRVKDRRELKASSNVPEEGVRSSPSSLHRSSSRLRTTNPQGPISCSPSCSPSGACVLKPKLNPSILSLKSPCPPPAADASDIVDNSTPVCSPSISAVGSVH
ncbi:unnamed protein product [Choristocarpus tenellus]